MKTIAKKMFSKGIVQLSLFVLATVNMSMSAHCLWFLNQPKVPENLTKEMLK